MKEEMQNMKLKVGSVLEASREARDSDKLLIMTIWQDQGLKLTPTQEQVFMEDCASPESIRRVRQKYQEQGMYVGTKRREKMNEERKVRETIRHL